MPIRDMGFTNIEKDKAWFGVGCVQQTIFDPSQLRKETPCVTSIVKMIKRFGQNRTGIGRSIKPADSTSPDCAVAITAKTINYIFPFEVETQVSIITSMAA